MSPALRLAVCFLGLMLANASARAQLVDPTVGSAQDDRPALIFRVFGGIGVGTRVLSWSEAGETLKVDTGAFAAIELGTSFFVAVSDVVALGSELAYRTSIAHEIEETHIGGQPDTLRIRSHSFDAVLAAAFSIGASGLRIIPAVGYGVRALRPEVHHLLTPSYSIAGPLLRITLRIPVFGGLALRLAPEAQWLFVGDELEEHGIESHGIGFGGEVALEQKLSSELSLELSARYARANLPAAAAAAASDTAQLATARLVWQP